MRRLLDSSTPSARWSAPLALLAALACTAPVPGCGGDLQKIEMPAAGVQLRYDLTEGTRYTGHVRRSETVTSPQGNLNRVLEYDIQLTVLGKDPNRGDILVAAVFQNVQIQWTLPPIGGFSFSVDEFIRDAVAKVQGMQVRFNVGADGKVNHLPPVPSEADSQLGLVIQAVLDSLDSAFLQIPDRTLQAGETWEETEKRGRKGKLGRYREGKVTATFRGLFELTSTHEKVAKLEIEDKGKEIITTKDGSRANEWNGTTTALFSVDNAYMIRRRGELRTFDPKQGTTFTKVQIDWTKQASAAPVPAPDPETQVETQHITDPCDPDYVGPGVCPGEELDPGAPPAEAGTPQATCDGDDDAAKACADEPEAATPPAAAPPATTTVSDKPRPTH